MEDIKTTYLKVNRDNPLIRIPALLFKNIDKRKKKIPLKLRLSKRVVSIIIDYEKLESKQ